MTIEGEIPVNAGLAEKLGLTTDEFARVRALLGRDPNFTELGMFSAMWSEHCSYKNSRKLFRHFPTRSAHVLVGAGEENSGIVDIGDGLGVSFKIESHNHPSAVEPFEASATGIGGCVRDIFTIGARPVAVLGSLRFGALERDRVRHLFREVIRGLAHYANTAEVSAVGGETCFDESYEGNPLVNAFVVGIVRHSAIVRGTTAGAGHAVYYIGGATGRDGVGGASFASQEITEESSSSTGAVAIGDPSLGRRLREACLELIERGLVLGMQDMGAAGLICSTCETAGRGGTGIDIDVASVPQRESGMTPYEILLSESQERMLAIFTEAAAPDARRILERWDVPVARIGTVTTDGMVRVRESGRVVAEVPAQALTADAPLYEPESCEPAYLKAVQAFERAGVPVPADLGRVLLALLDSPTIASKEAAYKSFTFCDASVVRVGPGSDAAVVAVPGTGKALAISVDCNGRHCYLNPYRGAMLAVAEAARNVVCAGGTPLAITDGLNFGNPLKPENYWQFEKCIEGLSAACRALGTPVISGNVSFYNENPKGAVDPTPIIGMVGLIEDATRRVTQDFKGAGDAIVLLGRGSGDLAGSEYLALIHGLKRGDPAIDIEFEKRVQAACLEAIAAGLVKSAHDVSDGGLAVCVAESCVSDRDGMLGATIDLAGLDRGDARIDEVLFGEAPSRIVLSVGSESIAALDAIAARHGVPCVRLGAVGSARLRITDGQTALIDLPVQDLSDIWRGSIPVKAGVPPVPGDAEDARLRAAYDRLQQRIRGGRA